MKFKIYLSEKNESTYTIAYSDKDFEDLEKSKVKILSGKPESKWSQCEIEIEDKVCETLKGFNVYKSLSKTSEVAVKSSVQENLKVFNYESWDGTKVSLNIAEAQRLVSGGGTLTENEFINFARKCAIKKLNPFIGECYPVKYGSGDYAQVMVVEDFRNVLRVAESIPEYAGIESGLILEDPETGLISPVEGSFYGNKKVVGGWCKVYRTDRKVPIFESVQLEEFLNKKKDGTPNQFWAETGGKRGYMMKKVAISLACKIAFPKHINGLIEEELGLSRKPLDVDYTDISENSNGFFNDEKK